MINEIQLVWIMTLNAKEVARKAFMDANKTAPLRQEFDAAEAAEKAAKDAYSKALRGEHNESDEV